MVGLNKANQFRLMHRQLPKRKSPPSQAGFNMIEPLKSQWGCGCLRPLYIWSSDLRSPLKLASNLGRHSVDTTATSVELKGRVLGSAGNRGALFGQLLVPGPGIWPHKTGLRPASDAPVPDPLATSKPSCRMPKSCSRLWKLGLRLHLLGVVTPGSQRVKHPLSTAPGPGAEARNTPSSGHPNTGLTRVSDRELATPDRGKRGPGSRVGRGAGSGVTQVLGAGFGQLWVGVGRLFARVGTGCLLGSGWELGVGWGRDLAVGFGAAAG
jgi:hypothetical protein